LKQIGERGTPTSVSNPANQTESKLYRQLKEKEYPVGAGKN
jgi:hypothetical protein